MLLGVGEAPPGERHLDDREGEDPAPVAAQQPELPLRDDDRHEDDDREQEASEHDHAGGEALDGDLDEQVRHAPDDRQGGEQDEAATGHCPRLVHPRFRRLDVALVWRSRVRGDINLPKPGVGELGWVLGLLEDCVPS